MEASALRHAPRVPVLTGLSPHLRLQSDERLVALVRRGHHGAFEALLKRYQPRLFAFCRHMLGSNEDAEDVLQEVFASAYNAICADERPINARPWLYRIARNRCLNHLRRPQDAGQESMDVFERESGTTAADTVHRREEFRQIVADVHDLPETQRTALLLREIDTLSYEQIADAMDTTVPSVKSLLVRARMSLAEASEARQLTCGEVRLQLTQAAEGISKSSPPVRRHVRSCHRCRSFRRELRRTSHALAAVYPVGPLLALKAALGGGTAGAGNGAAGGSTVAGAAGLAGSGGAGALSFAGASIVTKTAVGLVTAAVVTAGAAKVGSAGDSEQRDRVSSNDTPAAVTSADGWSHAAPAPVSHGRSRDSQPPAAARHDSAAGGGAPSAAPVAQRDAGPAPVTAAETAVEPDAPVQPAPVEAPPVVEEPYPPAAPPVEDDVTYTGEGTGTSVPGAGGEDTGGGFPTVTPAPSGGGEEPAAPEQNAGFPSTRSTGPR